MKSEHIKIFSQTTDDGRCWVSASVKRKWNIYTIKPFEKPEEGDIQKIVQLKIEDELVNLKD